VVFAQFFKVLREILLSLGNDGKAVHKVGPTAQFSLSEKGWTRAAVQTEADALARGTCALADAARQKRAAHRSLDRWARS
jgi:hypothetical protein